MRHPCYCALPPSCPLARTSVNTISAQDERSQRRRVGAKPSLCSQLVTINVAVLLAVGWETGELVKNNKLHAPDHFAWHKQGSVTESMEHRKTGFSMAQRHGQAPLYNDLCLTLADLGLELLQHPVKCNFVDDVNLDTQAR